jgi:hypothetical protein
MSRLVGRWFESRLHYVRLHAVSSWTSNTDAAENCGNDSQDSRNSEKELSEKWAVLLRLSEWWMQCSVREMRRHDAIAETASASLARSSHTLSILSLFILCDSGLERNRTVACVLKVNCG